MNLRLIKILRTIAIVLMGIAVAFTLLGAVGSTCVAFSPEKYEAMLPLAPFKWLYQLLVIASLIAGAAGIRSLARLARGAPGAYREALIVLLVAGSAALVQVIASRILRGKSMPTDVRLYVTALTLLVFLLLRIPGFWQMAGFARGERGATGLAGGAAAIVSGILALTVHFWAAPTHTFGGVNLADAFRFALAPLGWVLVLAGTWVLLRQAWRKAHQYLHAELRLPRQRRRPLALQQEGVLFCVFEIDCSSSHDPVL